MNEAATSPRLWWSLSETYRTWLAVSLAAVTCGLLAVGFQAALLGAEHTLIQRAQHAPGRWWVLLTLLSPALGGLLAGVIGSFDTPGARGSGLPQVKAAYALPDATLPVRDGALRFLLGTLQIGSGASLGAQGPTVHMCATLSGALGRWLSLSPRGVQQLLPVGAAAGVAAAFNTPIAAVAFVLEAIVGCFPPRLLAALLPAAALAAGVGHVLGAQPRLSPGLGVAPPSLLALPAYALLGALSGLVSVGFQRNVLHLRGLFQQSTLLPGWSKPAAGGLATGVCALLGLSSVQASGVAGMGYTELAEALRGCLPLATLLVLGVLKFGATLFSVASGGSGGVFAPSLFIGAMLGGAAGCLGQHLLGADQQHVFTLVGMGACFAGMVRAPLTGVLLLCELTGSLELLVPLAIANACAHLVARRCERPSLNEAMLARDGVCLPERSG